jgi:hypothetical protein
MKRVALLAAFPVLVAGCGTFDKVEEVRLQPKAGQAYYCMTSRLSDVDGTLVCNWHDQAKDACYYEPSHVELAKSGVASGPEKAGRCDNGEHLVRVTTK